MPDDQRHDETTRPENDDELMKAESEEQRRELMKARSGEQRPEVMRPGKEQAG